MGFRIGKHFVFLAVLFMAAGPVSAETLNLDQCIELALKNRAGIIRARGQERQAGADKLQALGQLLPAVRGSYSYTKGNEYDILPNQVFSSRDTIFTTIIGNDTAKDVGSIPTSFTDEQKTGPNKSWNLDANFEVLNFSNLFNYFSAKSSHESAHLLSIDTEQELILTVKASYYDYLRAVQNEEVNRQAVERSKEQLKLVESRYELGSAAYSDVLGQRVLYGNDRLELLRAQNLVTTAKSLLSYTIGTDPHRAVEFEVTDEVRIYEGTLEEAISFGLDHEPGLLAALQDVKASGHNVRSAWSVYLPNLSLFWRFTDFSGTQAFPTVFERSSKDKTYGFQVSYNIFDGFSRERELSRAKIGRNNAMADFGDARNKIVQEIETAYLNIQNQKEALAVTQESVNAAEENMKIVQERYNLGAATILDLLQAQEDLKRAQVSYINARSDLNQAIARLENAMGKP